MGVYARVYRFTPPSLLDYLARNLSHTSSVEGFWSCRSLAPCAPLSLRLRQRSSGSFYGIFYSQDSPCSVQSLLRPGPGPSCYTGHSTPSRRLDHRPVSFIRYSPPRKTIMADPSPAHDGQKSSHGVSDVVRCPSFCGVRRVTQKQADCSAVHF